MQNFAKVLGKRNTKVALRGVIPRGVSSNHVYRGRLAMPCMRRENVRHATLLSASSVTVKSNGADRNEVPYGNY